MRFSAFILFLALSALAFLQFKKSFYRQTYQEICHLVYERFYSEPPSLKTWHRHCLRDSDYLNFHATHAKTIQRLRWRFQQLNVSHLDIYEPKEFRSQWHGESESTGIESKWVDGELIITSQRYRDQPKNIDDCIEKLQELVDLFRKYASVID